MRDRYREPAYARGPRRHSILRATAAAGALVVAAAAGIGVGRASVETDTTPSPYSAAGMDLGYANSAARELTTEFLSTMPNKTATQIDVSILSGKVIFTKDVQVDTLWAKKGAHVTDPFVLEYDGNGTEKGKDSVDGTWIGLTDTDPDGTIVIDPVEFDPSTMKFVPGVPSLSAEPSTFPNADYLEMHAARKSGTDIYRPAINAAGSSKTVPGLIVEPSLFAQLGQGVPTTVSHTINIGS
jgi:hypothetical protein